MIVGVDESGDFRIGSRGLFVAVFVRPSDQDRIVARQRDWERTVRRALGLTNELKGSSVPDEWAFSFVSDVLDAGATPVRYQAYAVDVDQEGLEAIEVQREVFLSGYVGLAQTLRERSPDNARDAASWERQADWLRALKPVPLLKLMTLGRILPEVVEWAVARSIVEEFDRELESLSVRIDRGYIERRELSQWREVLRNIFIGHTQRSPLVFSTEWDDSHPFLRKFVDAPLGSGVVLKPAFKEAVDFYDSANSPVVRLADVVASLVRRSEFDGSASSTYAALRRHALHKYSYKVLRWTKDRQPFVNPFESG